VVVNLNEAEWTNDLGRIDYIELRQHASYGFILLDFSHLELVMAVDFYYRAKNSGQGSFIVS